MQIAIQGCPIKRNDDDFAAVVVVSLFLIFGHVQDGEGDGSHMAVLQEYAGAFQFLPMALAAALSFSSTFDLAAHPGGWLYIGAYVLVAIVALAITWWHRRGQRHVSWRP